MANCEIHRCETGVLFKLEWHDPNPVDHIMNISDATLQEITFVFSDHSTLTVTSVFSTDGSDGLIEYLSQVGDLNVAGAFKYQGHIISPTLGEKYSTIIHNIIHSNLP